MTTTAKMASKTKTATTSLNFSTNKDSPMLIRDSCVRINDAKKKGQEVIINHFALTLFQATPLSILKGCMTNKT